MAFRGRRVRIEMERFHRDKEYQVVLFFRKKIGDSREIGVREFMTVFGGCDSRDGETFEKPSDFYFDNCLVTWKRAYPGSGRTHRFVLDHDDFGAKPTNFDAIDNWLIRIRLGGNGLFDVRAYGSESQDGFSDPCHRI